MNQSDRDFIANLIAEKINKALDEKTSDGKISKSELRLSLSAHIVLEAVADALDLDKQQFKRLSGYGQPLAYFI